MPAWTYYGPPVCRYRDEKGRFVAEATIRDWGETSRHSALEEALEGVKNLQPRELETLLRALIKGEVIRQYLLGIGGKHSLTQADYGRMGGIIADQYRYLSEMIAKYENGEYTSARVAALVGMYINSTREAFERANAIAHGLPNMPAYPGDGGTPCLTNCKCHWQYEWNRIKQVWECTWTLTAAEHCSGCEDHAAEWSPLLVTPAGEFIND